MTPYRSRVSLHSLVVIGMAALFFCWRTDLVSRPSKPSIASAQRRSAPSSNSPDVRIELPASAEMQERAGLILSATFVGRETVPSFIAKPSEEWIHVLIRDSSRKIVTDRQLRQVNSGQSTVVSSAVVYGKLDFPFEVLRRCEALAPGRYQLEVRYESPGSNDFKAVSASAILPLNVRSDSSVPLRHLTLEVPDHVVHDDFRVTTFGVPVRVVNDGCELQNIVPFSAASAVLQVRTADGRGVSCRPAVAGASLAPIPLQSTESWQVVIPLSGRCDIPLPAGAGERVRYRVQLSYRGAGWTNPPLRLDKTVDLELANLPRSSPAGGLSPGTSKR